MAGGRRWWRSGHCGWGVHIAIPGPPGLPTIRAMPRSPKEWGVRLSPPHVSFFLQKPGVRLDPAGVLRFLFAARFPADALRWQDFLGRA